MAHRRYLGDLEVLRVRLHGEGLKAGECLVKLRAPASAGRARGGRERLLNAVQAFVSRLLRSSPAQAGEPAPEWRVMRREDYYREVSYAPKGGA